MSVSANSYEDEFAGAIRPASDFREQWQREALELVERAPFIDAIKHARNLSERFEAVFAYYAALRPVIERTPPSQWAHDVYEVPWQDYFTPIENMLWGDIRMEGVVLYPQHPVAGYFVDFGHPVAKVAIECDGKQWHQDKARDARRQNAIEAKGWTVYRLTGAQCMRQSEEHEDPETGRWIYELCEAQLLVREIGVRHGLRA